VNADDELPDSGADSNARRRRRCREVIGGRATRERCVEAERTILVVAQSTPDQLATLRIPLPGHPIWTNAYVDAFAHAYPGLNTTPWRPAR
jgi:hypothetical protein